MNKYILSIDAGTTGLTVLLFNEELSIVYKDYSEINQIYPKPTWVEHDPIELIKKINNSLKKITKKYNTKNIYSIGMHQIIQAGYILLIRLLIKIYLQLVKYF